MNKPLFAASIVSILSTFGCSAGSSGSLLDTCSGAYSCSDGSQTVSTQLEKSGDACTAGTLTLNTDGTVSGADAATWSGDAQQFDICVDGSCITCTASSGDVPVQPTTASCVTSHEHSMQCTALDPYDGTSTSCEDNVDPSKCVDSETSDYGGGCFFEDTYTRYTITTDCATYKAENPDLFK